jgi:drug/metabolite transporter (DMT)-like permease
MPSIADPARAPGGPTPPGEAPADSGAENTRGIAFILVAMASFIVADALTKMAGAELPTGEVIALRCAFGAAMMAPFVLRQGFVGHLREAYCLPMLLRNIGEIGGSLLYISSLVRLPIANCTSIMQTSPLAITAAAALFLGDKVGWRRWLATLAGLVGALIIIRPGGAEFSWWYMPAVLAVGFVTVRDLATRYIPRTTPTMFITFLTFVVVMCGGCVMGLFEQWRWPSVGNLMMLVGASFGLMGGYSCLIIALRTGETAAVIPFRYSIVLWSMLAGFIGWGHVPEPHTFVGIAIVVGAGVYTAHRERVRRREALASKDSR